MGDVSVHDGPEPLDGIEMRAIGRQWDQMNATVFARQERSDIGAFVVWGIVPNDVNDTFVRVSRLDLSEKLNGANPINWWLVQQRARRRFPGSERRGCSRAHAQMSFEWLDLTLCEPNHSWVYFDIPDERHPRSRRPRRQASYSVGFHKMR